jgi:hypothetical protein
MMMMLMMQMLMMMVCFVTSRNDGTPSKHITAAPGSIAQSEPRIGGCSLDQPLQTAHHAAGGCRESPGSILIYLRWFFIRV